MLKTLCKKSNLWPHSSVQVPLAILLGLGSTSALAGISDTVTPFVSVSYGYDDNLFRLPENNTSKASDKITSAVAGLAFERPIGRQVFTGSFKATRVTFATFDQLNYNGKEGAFNWAWQIGNHLDGAVGADYNEVLSSFSDFHITQKNIRTSKDQYASANWRFHPSWRLRGKVTRDQFNYDLASQQYLDRKETRGETGVDYLFASGSTIGIQARHSNGSYPHPLQFSGFVFDQGYKQTDLQLNVYWRYSAVTQIQFIGGRAKREHTVFSQRDASGTNGRLVATWTPRVALQLVGTAWRQFEPFEGSLASYSLSSGTSVGATWAVSSKLQAKADVKFLKRDFKGITAATVPTSTVDNTRTATLGANYAFRQNLLLGVSVFHDTRNSRSPFSSQYRANGATANLNFQF